MDRCPKCGKVVVNSQPRFEHYEFACGSVWEEGEWRYRGEDCYEFELASLQDQVADLKVQLTNLLDELHEDDATIAVLQAQLASAEASAEGMSQAFDNIWSFLLNTPRYSKVRLQALHDPAAGEWVTDYGNKYKHHATTAVEDKKANGTARGEE